MPSAFREIMIFIVAVLICILGICYGIIQFAYPQIYEKTLRLGKGYAPKWLERGYDPYSPKVRGGGLIWIAIFGAWLIWLCFHALGH